MDCNMDPMWDWDDLIMYNPSKTENYKNQPSAEWEIEKAEGIESMFPCFDGVEKVSDGSTSVFWHSHSTSTTNSSSPKVKQTNFASESSPGDSCSNIDLKAAESDLCLKLGKQQTYSEDFWCRDDNDLSAASAKTPCARKKQSMQVPRCQIDGCELDLSSAKDYHRKHRVCENHSKCPKVTVGGLERRFCQQCSKLHAVFEFDEKKRSCRKRLMHHNARRRKLPGMFPLNSSNRRQHINMLWDGLSLSTESEETFAWDTTTYDTKPTQMESGFTLSFQRGHGPDGEVFAGSNAYQTSGGFSAGKSNFQLPIKGLGEYSGGLHESQEFCSALSLLSTSSDSHGIKNNPMVESQPIHGTFPTHFI